MADIFISYSGEDKSIVRKMAALLESRGWTVWWDRQIPIGQKFDTVIENELNNAACVLVIWTRRSVSSEWVKNEAAAAEKRGLLVPVMLEDVKIPLAFERVEYARLTGWNGEEQHPELEILFNSIKNIIDHQPGTLIKVENKNAGKTYNEKTNLKFTGGSKYVLIGVASLLLLVVIVYFLMPNRPMENNITIRIFDWKKKPIVQGDVKIYLKEYIRTQSVDKMGQALFTELPADIVGSKIKIEVSSPGYVTKSFDTLLAASGSKLMELTLPFMPIVQISGKVKTAAEMPIKGVEVNVEGTKYYAISLTDGSYSLRLEEYTLGDEVTITTSHENFEDKTFALKINSPDIKNQDIFLNPAKK